MKAFSLDAVLSFPFFENIDGFAYLFTECPWATGIAEGPAHTREVNNMSPLWDLL